MIAVNPLRCRSNRRSSQWSLWIRIRNGLRRLRRKSRRWNSKKLKQKFRKKRARGKSMAERPRTLLPRQNRNLRGDEVSAIQQGVGTIQRALRAVGGHGGWLFGLLFTAGWLVLPSLGFAAEGTTAGPTEYRDIPYIGS